MFNPRAANIGRIAMIMIRAALALLRSLPLLRSMLARLPPKSTGLGASNTKTAVATAARAALSPHTNNA
jgi:hypothetical protein